MNQFFLSRIVLLVLHLKKSWPNLGSQKFSPMFSSRSFIVLGFSFRPMTHFEWTFVYGSRDGWSSVFVFPYRYSTVPLWFVKKIISSSLNCLCTFTKNQLPIRLLSLFLDFFLFDLSVLTLTSHWLDYCIFISFQIR